VNTTHVGRDVQLVGALFFVSSGIIVSRFRNSAPMESRRTGRRSDSRRA
jgi:hypothetical protein